MPNILEEQLRAIQYVISKKEALRATPNITPIHKSNLTHEIHQLQKEEKRILLELNAYE